MATNYETIIRENLTRLFDDPPVDLAEHMGAKKAGNSYRLRAFGEDCSLSPEGIRFSGNPATGPRGLLVSLYALNAGSEPMKTVPFRSFRELPGSMPYQGAFTSHTERVLVPHVQAIREHIPRINQALDAPEGRVEEGDFSLLLQPLPKIALLYIFYLPDEEFPASATCLFSANALDFMPLDGLADVGEYTSRAILRLIR